MEPGWLDLRQLQQPVAGSGYEPAQHSQKPHPRFESEIWALNFSEIWSPAASSPPRLIRKPVAKRSKVLFKAWVLLVGPLGG